MPNLLKSDDGATLVFPPGPFMLSAERSSALEELADQLVAEALQASDEFVLNDRVMDTERWKLVKEKGPLAAYRARESRPVRPQRPDREVVVVPDVHRTKGQPPSKSAIQDEGYRDRQQPREWTHGVLEESKLPNVPLISMTGVVPGTVEDAALGFLADTDVRGRMRSSNEKNVLVADTRVLAKIRGPTREQPFRFLGIKWSSHDSPTRGVLIKARDYVILESTGLALDAKGEPYCYFLNHSIELEQVPDFRAFGQVRVTYSTCIVVRSHAQAPAAIEVFSRGFMDAGGHIGERMGTAGFCDGLLAFPHFVEDSYLKKLTWLMSVEHCQSSTSVGGSSFGASFIRTDRNNRAASDRTVAKASDSRQVCACCEQKFQAGLAKLLASNTTCGLCRRLVCRKCTVKKTLPVDAAPGELLVTRDMTFCVHCYLVAREMPARRVALASVPKQPRELGLPRAATDA